MYPCADTSIWRVAIGFLLILQLLVWTICSMGDNTDVDTSSFRCAIWNYIHCMFGIRHDDYDYQEVNQLLERSLKSYIKTVTCYPERICRKDYESFMKEFKHSEKVGIVIRITTKLTLQVIVHELKRILLCGVGCTCHYIWYYTRVANTHRISISVPCFKWNKFECLIVKIILPLQNFYTLCFSCFSRCTWTWCYLKRVYKLNSCIHSGPLWNTWREH